MIAIATHAVFLQGKDIYGPPHAVSTYLNKRKIAHVFIKHALYPTQRFSLIETYSNGELSHTTKLPIHSPIYALRMLEEQWINVRILWRERVGFYVAVNPVNYVSARILQLLGRAKKTVYFSADFALSRFENPLMNRIYHMLDTQAQDHALQTWSVSARIVAYRKKHGLTSKRNILVRNAPFFEDVKRKALTHIKPHDLVVVSALEPGVAFELLINVVETIRKKIPDVRLILVGSGSKEQELRTMVSEKALEKHIVFMGALSHSDMFKVTTKCGVGIALYDVADPNHFRYFSDPMKVRDYLASGLPVLISGNSAIGDELEHHEAGFKVELKKQSIEKILLKLMKRDAFYQNVRKNAIELALTTDAKRTFDVLLKHI